MAQEKRISNIVAHEKCKNGEIIFYDNSKNFANYPLYICQENLWFQTEKKDLYVNSIVANSKEEWKNYIKKDNK
jgi:hypothetical protein